MLKGACLEAAAGELVGLAGENRSRKSTLMQIIVGLLKRDAGEVDRAARVGYSGAEPSNGSTNFPTIGSSGNRSAAPKSSASE